MRGFDLSLFLVMVAACAACGSPPPPVALPPTAAPAADPWAARVGAAAEVEGIAVDRMGGAFLATGEGDEGIWVDGLESWPGGIYRGGRDGARVRVKGTVVRRDDLPVIEVRPGEPPAQGIPVEPGADLGVARIRYLLAGATWEVLVGPPAAGARAEVP